MSLSDREKFIIHLITVHMIGVMENAPEEASAKVLDALKNARVRNLPEEEAEEMMKRLSQGSFDMNDMLKQIGQLKKLGGLSGVMSMLPGIGKLQKQMEAHNFDDKVIAKQEAIIYSMTKKERTNVGLLNASRRKRIASGSGSSVHEVNRLVKQQQDMARMMKKVGKVGVGKVEKVEVEKVEAEQEKVEDVEKEKVEKVENLRW